MKLLPQIALAASLLPGLAHAGLFDFDYARAARRALVAQRCPEAIYNLNRGLEKPDATLNALAGRLYEYGECVDENWETAAQFYQRAHSQNEPSALSRLVVLHATAMRDPAAAMWWAAHKPDMLPSACVPRTPPEQAQSFVEELRQWTVKKLAACVGVAEISYRLWHETSFRWTIGPRDYVETFDVDLDFGAGTVEWRSPANKTAFRSRVDFASGDADESEEPEPSYRLMWRNGVVAMRDSRKIEALDKSWRVSFKLNFDRDFQPSRIPTTIYLSN